MLDRSGELFMKFFFAGMSDFTVVTLVIRIGGENQQDVMFALEPDTVSQEPNETFRIEATIIVSRSLEPNEFIQRTKVVTIIDITSKQQ